MTALDQAIKNATESQYPGSSTGSPYEDALAWQIENMSKLPTPDRHVRLVVGRKFEVDFVWRKQKIVVEIDGGVWMQSGHGPGGGAHSRPANIIRDMEKSNLVQAAGFRFFRFTPDQVENYNALEFIMDLF